ncbi:MAG: protein-glutamate O-methyltransferase [Nitrospirae bacterium]|nr:protein-glutamate O-methyltransferase [Nitrospirota bacterium]
MKTFDQIIKPAISNFECFSDHIEISDQEFEMFRGFIYSNAGINLNSTKKNLLQTRLIKRLKQTECESFSQYFRLIKNDSTGEELIAMLNAISTNLTRFFREEEHFKFLKQTVLPAIIANKRKKDDRRIRIWSAACSSGEEPYTLGLTLLPLIENPLGWDIKILATDISTDILKKASEGIYEEEKVSDIPKNLLETFFTKEKIENKTCYYVKPLLHNIITFRRLNLIQDNYPFKGKFDFIFCRNVMIYFDKKTQEGIVNKFYNYLEDGGYLFIGHSESLNGVKSPFKYIKPAVYKKGGE